MVSKLPQGDGKGENDGTVVTAPPPTPAVSTPNTLEEVSALVDNSKLSTATATTEVAQAPVVRTTTETSAIAPTSPTPAPKLNSTTSTSTSGNGKPENSAYAESRYGSIPDHDCDDDDDNPTARKRIGKRGSIISRHAGKPEEDDDDDVVLGKRDPIPPRVGPLAVEETKEKTVSKSETETKNKTKSLGETKSAGGAANETVEGGAKENESSSTIVESTQVAMNNVPSTDGGEIDPMDIETDVGGKERENDEGCVTMKATNPNTNSTSTVTANSGDKVGEDNVNAGKVDNNGNKNQDSCDDKGTNKNKTDNKDKDNDKGKGKGKDIMNKKNTKEPETAWEELLNDANEFDNLTFSLCRRSARVRLQKFAQSLKQLSAKLKRVEEVREGMKKREREKEAAAANAKEFNPTSAQDELDENSNSLGTNKKQRLNNNANEAAPLFIIDRKPVSSPRSGSREIISSDAKELTAAPLLKPKDKWVQYHSEVANVRCPDFDACCACPLITACTRLHLYNAQRDRPLLETLTEYTMNDNKAVSRSVAVDPRHRGRGGNGGGGISALPVFSREDLERAYLSHRGTQLTTTDYAEKIKPDLLNQPRYASCLHCPIDNTLYYGQPLPMIDKIMQHNQNKIHHHRSHPSRQPTGQQSAHIIPMGSKSSQGIYWYTTMKEARDAVAMLVIMHLKSRKVLPEEFLPDPSSAASPAELAARHKRASAIAARSAALQAKAPDAIASKVVSNSQATVTVVKPENLPVINPWNWMELHRGKRCTAFHTVSGCPYGESCGLSHVHYPKSVTQGQVPARTDLMQAYARNFARAVLDPLWSDDTNTGTFGEGVPGRAGGFGIKSAHDLNGRKWFVAAWGCPRDGTVYYAAGGLNGFVGAQNMFLYPTVDDAKLAACGVALDAFRAKGLWVGWDSSKKPDAIDPRRPRPDTVTSMSSSSSLDPRRGRRTGTVQVTKKEEENLEEVLFGGNGGSGRGGGM